MSKVTNTSADAVEVPLFGLHFEPGETQDVDPEVAASLGGPFKVDSESAPAAVVPSAAAPAPTTQPDEVAAAEAELEKAKADLEAAQSATKVEAPK